ncbi:MAG: ATP-binding protein [Eubacteriales bacterium]
MKNVVIGKAENYYHILIETSLDPFITINQDGIITDVNRATEHAAGRSKEELIGTDFSAYFSEPEKARIFCRNVFLGTKVYEYELDLKHINGKITTFVYNAAVFKDDKGNVLGAFASARDITASRKAEDELKYLKNNLEILVKQRTEELSVSNRELVFQSGEKADRAAELLIADKELTFQSAEKADRAAELIIADKELTFQSGEKADRAAELLIANKELAYQNYEKEKRAAELLIANKELAFQNTEKEKRATELLIANKEKEKRAAELLIANRELTFQSGEKADRAAELIIADKELTFQSGEKADRAAELLIANKELAFQNEEKEKRAAELLIANKELVFQNKEKEKRAAELNIAYQDLAFQKEKIVNLNNQLEYRVIERTAQLEAANKELEALSYSISHDLKAPLRHITGYVSLLVKKYRDLFPEEGRHYIDNISLSASNMGELIEGLLQFSRTGRIEMNKTYISMNEIVSALIHPTQEQDTEHRIEFNVDPMPFVFADLEMIKSVWSNLIENAVKFTRNKDYAKISIGAEEKEDSIIYHIVDNGAGFDMNYAPKLFAVFQRLHSRDDYEGTGIGLATVKRIIERHGGQTWANGKVGEGASFYFSLCKRKEGE